MKFASTLLAAVLVATVSSIPITRRDVNPDLVPDFGHAAGVNPTGTGDCDGAVNDASGNPIKVPCACPPDRNSFIQELNANVAAGHVLNNPTVQLSFPEDDSQASQSARLNAAAVTLQNLNGTGQGCPIASTTFSAQQKAIDAGTSTAPAASAPAVSASAPAASASSIAVEATPAQCGAPPAASAPAASAPAPSASSTPTASSGTASADQIAQLAPDLGFTAGQNPTGTGDCDGAVNGANGKPIAIPCACPPDQDTFIQHLTADVEAGHAVNNPTVQVSFPTDGSVQSQITRINTALVTLQNLNGEGKGCPAVSTTLQAQQKALQAQL